MPSHYAPKSRGAEAKYRQSQALVKRVKECAEAVCSAFFQLGWENIGESENGQSTYWIWRQVEDRSKWVRVVVHRNAAVYYCTLQIEWWNTAGGALKKGSMDFQILCDDSVDQHSIEAAASAGVVKALEILKDVLTGEGVASASALAPNG